MQQELESIQAELAGHKARLEKVRARIEAAEAPNNGEALEQLQQENVELLRLINTLSSQSAAAAAAGGGAPGAAAGAAAAAGGPKMRTAMDDITAVYCAAVRVLTEGALGSDHEHVKAH
jgi:cell division protein FtsB